MQAPPIDAESDAATIGRKFVDLVFSLRPVMTDDEGVRFAGLMRWLADRVEFGDEGDA